MLTSHSLVQSVQQAFLPVDCNRLERLRRQEALDALLDAVRELCALVQSPSLLLLHRRSSCCYNKPGGCSRGRA